MRIRHRQAIFLVVSAFYRHVVSVAHPVLDNYSIIVNILLRFTL